VVDKRTLNVIFVSAMSVASFIFPLLMSLIPGSSNGRPDARSLSDGSATASASASSGGVCNVTGAEIALVRNVFEARGCPMDNATLIAMQLSRGDRSE
jgi:hypothetical protein